MTTRRDFLKGVALGGGAAAAGVLALEAVAAPRPLLIDAVGAACRRLADHGWRALLLKTSRGGLDITAGDLRAELGKELRIDRGVSGFGDFARAGNRGIEPGNPSASLLYHAFASPDVVEDGSGAPLGAFPTLAEIEAVENYVYGARPPTLAELRARAENRLLGIVVFALQYRSAAGSVHRRHADMCFSRIGVARIGTVDPRYDAQQRGFEMLDHADPYAFRAVPQRFAAYIAMQAPGSRGAFVPQDYVEGDNARQFWVPLHKLFDGPECLAGQNLSVTFAAPLQNEKLRRFHAYLEGQGKDTGWKGADLDNFPFVIRDELIGAISRRPEYGSGVLEPRPAPFVTPARYRDQPLAFNVPPIVKGKDDEAYGLYFSSAQILPPEPEAGDFMNGIGFNLDRPAPEYISIRRRVREDGSVDDLNRDPCMMCTLQAGRYRAQHFIDFAGEGWIEARVPQLASQIGKHVPAYCLVAPPDFFPLVNQRDLAEWWRRDVPEAIRGALWAIQPIPLTERRLAPNPAMSAGFEITDVTATAIVSHPVEPGRAGSWPPPTRGRYSGLPDASPGVFDPGWDASLGIHPRTGKDAVGRRRSRRQSECGPPDAPDLSRFLQSYGLGTPFVEDIKLCAALGSYWPAVAPDSSRAFTPHKEAELGAVFPWPTIVPLTDEEIGIVPVPGHGYMPWDGVRGPRLVTAGGHQVVAYADIARVDYIGTVSRLTPFLLARIDLAETKARVLAMSAVYWSLGIHDPKYAKRGSDPRCNAVEVLKDKAGWSVLSFRAVAGKDDELAKAEADTGVRLSGRRYRFHVYRPGGQIPDPQDLMTVLVTIAEEAVAYVDDRQVLLYRDKKWRPDATMPRPKS
jgi:hypothetical protein